MTARSGAPAETASRPASVAGRLMAIINCFTGQDPALTLAELQDRTGLPRSTVHRLAQELLDWGGLERAPGGHYRVGLRLYELGMMAPRQRRLRELALPVMEDLYLATGDNVHLGVLDGTQVLVVEKVTGLHSARAPSSPGGRLPLHATAIGKALLAFSPASMIDQVIASGLEAFTDWTITDGELLADDLARTRERGYAVAYQERSWGTASVSAPILDVHDAAVAALSVVGDKDRMNVEAVATAVCSVAFMLGHELAGVTRPPA
ncbi:IclR family transcriptional regulator [Pseudonocardia nigra]|uniref:IclR family transcriptional regulator n=1 Tax=Pseudonocardia nigra TaxID=1921578 RepID=UPI001C5E6AD4|nr:IclR family transcriptional regulator [Pseudonocardia nigra]